MYKLTVNDSHFYDIDSQLTEIVNTENKINLHLQTNGSYTVLVDGIAVQADVVGWDENSKTATIKINQNKYQVVIKEPADLLVEKLGIQLPKPKKANNLVSPMPGLILKILVQPGQAIKKGETLLVLEAMKMENSFKAPADAIIKEIKISEKQAVEKGQELITFE